MLARQYREAVWIFVSRKRRWRAALARCCSPPWLPRQCSVLNCRRWVPRSLLQQRRGWNAERWGVAVGDVSVSSRGVRGERSSPGNGGGGRH
eukprot:5018278-Prymnesium_polylepis.1